MILLFQLALTLYCRTNIISKNGSEGDELTDGRFQPTDGRFELVDANMGSTFRAKKNSPEGCPMLLKKQFD
ncbi:hypothetical protein D2V93_16355 [Flagellimonas taeanensis]|nr:hypothetical protein D2V93_16355 [Allomuricauda taeanensis]